MIPRGAAPWCSLAARAAADRPPRRTACCAGCRRRPKAGAREAKEVPAASSWRRRARSLSPMSSRRRAPRRCDCARCRRLSWRPPRVMHNGVGTATTCQHVAATCYGRPGRPVGEFSSILRALWVTQRARQRQHLFPEEGQGGADNRASPPDQSNGPWGRLLEPESRVPSQSKQLWSGRAHDRTSGLTVRGLTQVCPVDARPQPFTRLMGRSATVPRSGDQAHSPRSSPCRPLAITSPPTAVFWSVPKESAMSPRGKRMSGADRRNGLKSLQRLMPTPGIEPGTY